MSPPSARIAIRADGGGPIGLGHVMRCGALAHALNDRDIGVDWITMTPDVLPWSVSRIVRTHDIASRDNETGAISRVLAEQGCAALVGDWKETDATRVAAVRKAGWPVILIGGWTGEAVGDLHVRQSFDIRPPQGGRTELSGAQWLLLGPAYCHAKKRKTRDSIGRVLVSLGGTDTPMLARIRNALTDDPRIADVTLDIRTPGGARTADRISPLHDALAGADIAVLAGGTTLHEAAALGLPAICVPIVPGQFDRAGQFQRLGLGIALDPEVRCFERRLTDILAGLAADPARRARMARRGQTLVDGRGAGRLADHLIAQFLPACRESQ